MDPLKARIREAVRSAYDLGYHSGQRGDVAYSENVVEKAMAALGDPFPARPSDSKPQPSPDEGGALTPIPFWESCALEAMKMLMHLPEVASGGFKEIAHGAAALADAMDAEREKRRGPRP